MPLPVITTLGHRVTRDMLERAQAINSSARRADAETRLLIDAEGYLDELRKYIRSKYSHPRVRVEVAKMATRVNNILKRYADRVSVAYKIPPRRSLDGATEQQQRTYADIWREGKINVRAKRWARQALIVNVVLVVPFVRVRNGVQELSYQTILPHQAEAYFADEDLETPAVVVWTRRDHSDATDRPLRTIALDADAWTLFDDRGRVERKITHNLGFVPVTQWRVSPPDEDDWWSSTRGSAAVDATMECGRLHAHKAWVRLYQSHKHSTLLSEDVEEAVPKGQILDPGVPLSGNVNPTEIEYKLYDSVTDPAWFDKEIRFVMEQFAETYRVPVEVIDPMPSGGMSDLANARIQSAVIEVREDQIDQLRESERDLAWKTAKMLEVARHPLALPAGLVSERAMIEYAPPTYIDTPKTRADVLAQRLDMGIIDRVQAVMEEHPEWTEQQAEGYLVKIDRRRAERDEVLAKRNLPSSPADDQENLAQVQGRAGQLERDMTRKKENEDE